MYVKLFGPTRVMPTPAARACDPIKGVKPREILGILASNLGHPISKDALAELVWDGSPPRSYVASLESYICVLRRQLGLPSGRGGALATTSRGYLLDPAVVAVDLVEFRRLMKAAERARGAESVRLTQQALELADGPLLASESYVAWADEERRTVIETLVRGCVRAAECAEEVGDHAAAVALAERALEADRLTEPAWLVRMRCLAAQGRRIEALACFAELRSAVADAIGMEPSPEAERLYFSLLRGDRSVEPAAGANTAELQALLGLLRQALEAVPGATVPDNDRHLSAVAVEVVRRELRPHIMRPVCA